jgi:hypothetical protein
MLVPDPGGSGSFEFTNTFLSPLLEGRGDSGDEGINHEENVTTHEPLRVSWNQ